MSNSSNLLMLPTIRSIVFCIIATMTAVGCSSMRPDSNSQSALVSSNGLSVSNYSWSLTYSNVLFTVTSEDSNIILHFNVSYAIHSTNTNGAYFNWEQAGVFGSREMFVIIFYLEHQVLEYFNSSTDDGCASIECEEGPGAVIAARNRHIHWTFGPHIEYSPDTLDLRVDGALAPQALAHATSASTNWNVFSPNSNNAESYFKFWNELLIREGVSRDFFCQAGASNSTHH
jgi:hypothetical protein